MQDAHEHALDAGRHGRGRKPGLGSFGSETARPDPFAQARVGHPCDESRYDNYAGPLTYR